VDFQADVQIHSDSSILVIERVLTMGSDSLRRSFPLHYGARFSYDVDIEVNRVYGSNGQPLPYQTEKTSGEHLLLTVKLPAGSAQHEPVWIDYTVRHAIRYWRKSGGNAWLYMIFKDSNDGPVPIDHVLVTATLPSDPGSRSGFDASLYGPTGALRTGSKEIRGNQFRWEAAGFDTNDWVQIGLSIPNHVFRIPWTENLRQFWEINRSLVLVAILMALMLYAGFRRRALRQ